MTQATWNSVNTYYVQLEEKVGVYNVANMARRLGVTSYRVEPRTPRGVWAKDGTLTLGTFEVSVMDMASAYATLAAHGVRCDPHSVLAITDAQGQVPIQPSKCQPVLRPEIADKVTSVLEGVITQGTGAANAPIGRPAAGKTGTTDNFSNAWFVGYVPQMAAAVWVGDPRSTVQYPLRNVTVPVGTYPHVYGGDLPAMIWSNEMRGALVNYAVASLPLPDATVAPGTLPGTPGQPGQPGQLGQLAVSWVSSVSSVSSVSWASSAAGAGRARAGQAFCGRGGRPASRRVSLRRAAAGLPRTGQPEPSTWRTTADTRRPSARPATAAVTAFIAAPIAFGPDRPASARTLRTSASSSSSDSCRGRYPAMISASARSLAAESALPACSKASAASRRLRSSRRRTVMTSSSVSSRATAPATSWVRTADSVSRRVETRNSSRAFMAAVRSACSRSDSSLTSRSD